MYSFSIITFIKSWYRELSPRFDDEAWQPSPSLITTKTRVTPNLLRLTWKGFPMHHYDKLGWGYLMNKEQYGILYIKVFYYFNFFNIYIHFFY